MGVKILKPQPGPQESFLASPADITIYGGAAGGGKTYGLLMSPLRNKNVEGYGCVIFRKNFNQIFAEGGLWDESSRMYHGIKGASPKLSRNTWQFKNQKGRVISKVSFAHIERDEEVHRWQGSQICDICFDELTHFSEFMFFYMLSRNRSVCGVRPTMRGTCNPDADSWVAKFIDWWIHPDTGYPIKERSGSIRWMIRRNETLEWASTRQELIDRFELVSEEDRSELKSVTFIASTIEDNQILLKSNPSYRANLKAMPQVERERLLYGNWKIKPAAGLYFKRTQVNDMIEIVPSDVTLWCRAWDLAATAEDEGGDPAYTSGVLMGRRKDGRFIIADVINVRMNAGDVRNLIRHTAARDKAKFGRVKVRLPKDPGQAGKDQAQSYIKFLAGYNVVAIAETGSKEARAEPTAAQWQGGNFDVVIGDWNDMFLSQLESFPSSKYKDMVDATNSAFAELAVTFDIRALNR